ncbi:hypothetical protein KCP76_26445 (plasmid) [Salmonella enterica subsp. enterica serovar Weltevreden]|nr:hypothetical protein KCP76_26445 [Salmonella enterica subsp. enterica serovar Weltevreden]QUJ01268.1 hypothetical protein KCP73_27190 [Salmonella enterica subsp. enterica]
MSKGYTRLYKNRRFSALAAGWQCRVFGANDPRSNHNGYRIELGEIESALTAPA